MTLGKTDFPPGITKTDEYFGEQVIYHDELVARVPLARAAGGAQPLALAVTYQGCAEAGLCYPPTTKTFNARSAQPAARRTASPAASAYVSEQDSLAGMIVHGNLLVMLAMFFAAGLVLAFTPCVLPMVPILSRLIAGQGTSVTTRRAFALSLTYVLGMAFTYTAAGAAAAAAGQQVQAAVPASPGSSLTVRHAVRGDGAVDVRAVHGADARGAADAPVAAPAIASAPAPSAASPRWARCRR